ncbi:MAG: multidrug effflux MFS transporter [Rhodobacteraceae bacterium]|jgi:DHA1 family bicyclomycin/chloramphenicol resistance-like MFS transporter|nr:multidrug effflux MFS transporter [Paracoccaceae bacterium]
MRPAAPLAFAEFVAMMAMLFAVLALSVDAMLPAIPEIAAELSPAAPNRAQLVIAAFILGTGLGMVVLGPASDSFGRRPVIAVGMGLYLLGGLGAAAAPTLEVLLAARVLQGFGVAATRVVGNAMIRDLHSGRRMAQVTSTVMTIFILLPAAAPALGQAILWVAGWREIFLVLMAIACAALAWFLLRQPETLAPERRRPFRAGPIAAAAREVVANRAVRIYILILGLGFGQMLALLSVAQPVFAVSFGRDAEFPAWFAVMALAAGGASLVNARLVIRLGMRRMATAAYLAQTVISLLLLPLWAAGVLPAAVQFPAFFLWAMSVMFMAGVTFGNLNALALEPLGHIAGLAAAVIGAASSLLSVAVAVPIGQAFDGTPLPLMAGVLACSAAAYGLMRITRRLAGDAY